MLSCLVPYNRLVGKRMQVNPEPLAVVKRRNNVTAAAALRGRSRADRLRAWLAQGGTEAEFDEIYPPKR